MWNTFIYWMISRMWWFNIMTCIALTNELIEFNVAELLSIYGMKCVSRSNNNCAFISSVQIYFQRRKSSSYLRRLVTYTCLVTVRLYWKAEQNEEGKWHFDWNWTHLLNFPIHIQINCFGGIGGGAGAHLDLPLLSYTPRRFWPGALIDEPEEPTIRVFPSLLL